MDQGTWSRALNGLAQGPKTELLGSSEHEEVLVKETENERPVQQEENQKKLVAGGQEGNSRKK